ncbi:chaperonin [Culex quinquefasciatus]|uniref:Chaperonin n=1 Tax=Culex quinquefasciatus TaxID=7176 RepID=B0XKJ8_CULQU|nr:chaperonin [Culex quinquefasciatus]|eukprot:XP_001870170.1 chaperonin [Culex quinquefasciatus]
MRLAWNDFRDGVGVRVAAMLSEAEKLLEQKFYPQTSAAKQAPKLCAGCCLEDSFLDKGFLLDKKTPNTSERKVLDRQHADGHGQDQGLDGEDCCSGGRREGEDEGQGDNQDQARLGRCDLFESLHRCDRPFQHLQATVPEYLARRQVAAQQKLRPKVVSEEFGGDFGGIRGGEKVHGRLLLLNTRPEQNTRYILVASESASAAKDTLNQLGSIPWKINSEHLHAGPFLPSLSPIEETVPRSELTGYDWFILMRKKMTHWRKAHLIPPHLNHSLSP